MGLRPRLCVLYRNDVRPAQRPVGPPAMNRALPWIVGAALIALPFVWHAPYPMHLMVVVLIWSFAYTSWSVMGRFGLVSLGHGGFMGAGAYCTALLWNYFHLSPFLGIPVGMAVTVALALLVA